MPDVTKYLHELLYRHDCVILTGFGGFILRSSPGGYDPVRRVLTPPIRQVTFNRLLTADDGLLTSNISEKEGVDYAIAKKHILLFIDELKKGLQDNGEAMLEGIGKFSISDEKKWIFTPEPEANFLESSFGFTSVYARPKLPQQGKKPVRTAKKRVDRRPTAQKLPVPGPVKWTVFASIPIIIFLLWGIIFPASFQQKYTSYSGFMSDFFHTESMEPVNPVKTLEKDNDIKPLQVNDEPAGTFEIVEELPADRTEENTNIVSETFEEPVQKAPDTAITQRYHIIGGVFSKEINASRYMEALTRLGYNPSMAGTSKNGLHRVSYDNFPTWSEALAYLKKIKANENPSAWILKY
jgi:nucleoid DNA-binding protein